MVTPYTRLNLSPSLPPPSHTHTHIWQILATTKAARLHEAIHLSIKMSKTPPNLVASGKKVCYKMHGVLVTLIELINKT